MLDLHRHSQYSTFDGFGRADEIAQTAVDLGYTSLGLSDHGNTNGLVQHYYACHEVGIKPILGVEAYFLPVLKEKTRGFHLCLFAKNVKGYENINRLQTIGETQKYHNPIITFKDLRAHCEGVICTTACVASFFAQRILNGDIKTAERALIEMQTIFSDDLYIEIQPYKASDNEQETVNYNLMMLGNKLGIKCILTSDSHYPKREDFDTYMIMHEIAKHTKMDIEATYSERYMPTREELMQRFIKMHEHAIYEPQLRAQEMMNNLKEIEDKVDGNILDKLNENMPSLRTESHTSFAILALQAKRGLEEKGLWNKTYATRLTEELNVIREQGYEDYFLMVADYVAYAKQRNIAVGPGRGSACNSLTCFATGITNVDSVKYNLDFSRFMRSGKKKMPDIDVDFETARRAEVIEYVVKRYQGKSAQICSYGLYKTDVLVNDLVKVCGLGDSKASIASIKKHIKSFTVDGDIDTETLKKDKESIIYNKLYNNIIKHFCKLYKKVKYIGTHAAGVAITGNDIQQHTALRHKDGKIFTNYDLVDIEKTKVIKFDMLGLKTLQILRELKEITGESFTDEWTRNPNVIEAFRKGETDGIFQFEKEAPKNILRAINCDCFQDIVAVNALNRPAMLDLDMDDKYRDAKLNNATDVNSAYYKYVKDTYGCIIYQEQVLSLAKHIGGFTADEADILVKMEHGASSRTKRELDDKYYTDFRKKFVTNAIKHDGITKAKALELFDACAQYGFNKGHSTAYSLIAVEEMYYKIHYPNVYWSVKIRHEANESNQAKFKSLAVKSGSLVFLPHVNYSAYTKLRPIEDELIIQEGLSDLKGIGAKAAEAIENERIKNGDYQSKEDFINRCKGRAVTTRVITILETNGALNFDEGLYMARVKKYNVALHSRAFK